MNDAKEQDVSQILRHILNLSTTSGRTLAEATVFDGYSLWLGRQYSLSTAISKVLNPGHINVAMPSRSGPKVTAQLSIRLRQIVAHIVSLIGIIWLSLSRGRLLVYDLERNNPVSHAGSRIRKVYELADEQKIKYAILVHSLFGANYWKFLLAAKCPVIYAESIHFWSRLLAHIFGGGPVVGVRQWADVPENVRDLVVRELGTLSAVYWSVRLFYHIGRITGLRGFISHDDIRHTNEMLIGFKLAHVKTIVAQHGNFNYLVGLDVVPPKISIFPDYFCVSSTYWRDRLPQLSPLFAYYRNNLLITGWLGTQLAGQFMGRDASHRKRGILIPYELLADYSPMKKLIRELVRGGYTVLFKIKPNTPIGEQVELYDIQDGEHGIRIIECLNEEEVDNIGAAIGVYSTLLDEMILSGIPIGIVRTKFPIFDDKVDSGIANGIDLEGDTIGQVRELCEITDEETKRRRRFYGDEGSGAGVALKGLLA